MENAIRDVWEVIGERREARKRVAAEAREMRKTGRDIRAEGGQLSVAKQNQIVSDLIGRRRGQYNLAKLTARQAKREAEALARDAIGALAADISHLPCGADDAHIEGAQYLRDRSQEMWGVYMRLAVEEARRESGSRGWW